MNTIIGLDVGGTKTTVVEGTADGHILQRHEIPTLAAIAFPNRFPAISNLIETVIRDAEAAGRQPIAISASIGGPLRIAEGVLLDPPHLPGWHGIALKAELQRRFPSLPAFVEHDGNTGALAEFHFGVGRDRTDLQHLIFLTFGTGIGGGLIVNGKIVHGATDTAGEIGHLRLAENGPVGFGKAGSWEGFASGAGMVEVAAAMYPQRWQRDTPIRNLVDAMLADDDQALQAAATVGNWLGRGLALLIDTLNPQVIVLGSLAVALGERVLAPAREVVAQEALPQAAAACEITPAALGKRLGDVAALMAALNAPTISSLLANNSSAK